MMPSHYPLSDYDKGELREEGFMRKIEWSECNGMDAFTRKDSRKETFYIKGSFLNVTSIVFLLITSLKTSQNILIST